MNVIAKLPSEREHGLVTVYRESESDSDDLRPLVGLVVGVILSLVLWCGLVWTVIHL